LSEAGGGAERQKTSSETTDDKEEGEEKDEKTSVVFGERGRRRSCRLFTLQIERSTAAERKLILFWYVHQR
jgi:hypothetical protein